MILLILRIHSAPSSTVVAVLTQPELIWDVEMLGEALSMLRRGLESWCLKEDDADTLLPYCFDCFGELEGLVCDVVMCCEVFD